MSRARQSVLIDARELAEGLARGDAITLLDVRDEASPDAAPGPLLRGALRVHLASDFSGAPSSQAGKRPLPSISDLQARARQWGLRRGQPVVVYDASGGAQAGRAWWTLRWAGVPAVRILDGGLQAAVRAGLPTQDTPAAPPGGGDIALSAGHMPTLHADAAQALASEGRLFDARGAANFVAGHIPGARNVSAAALIDGTGVFAEAAEVRKAHRLAAQETGGVGVYCGSGNAAAQSVAALAASGVEAALYVGSWSAWSADESRPRATGTGKNEEPRRPEVWTEFDRGV